MSCFASLAAVGLYYTRHRNKLRLLIAKARERDDLATMLMLRLELAAEEMAVDEQLARRKRRELSKVNND